ncbi:MAG: CoA transferase [Gammaproteobacteria bacterium]|nr:CoA transferase [Gammaproteobacteria bacterium]
MKALTNFRVLDFSHILAGPLATHFLLLQGAEVIKVESPGRGDNLRYYGQDRRYDGMAPAFINVNAGKKSIALNLKSAGGKEIALALARDADVIVENFKPGTIERLGFDYERCKAFNPDVVYCSISGYGQSGEYRDYPAVDNIVQGTSGMMSASGTAEDGPIRVGFPAVDNYTGTLAAMAIIAALLRRERTGQGQHIDVAMLDAGLLLQSAIAVPYLVTGQVPPKSGNTGYSNLPTAGVFETRDGKHISIGAIQQNQFETLARALGHPELLDDPVSATAQARARPENRQQVRDRLQQIFRERNGEEWEQLLCQAGAAAGLIRTLDQACNHPALAERSLKQPLHIAGLPDSEDIHVLNAGFELDCDNPGVSEPPPGIGEHTDLVLAGLGYTPQQIAALRDTGAVA